MLMQYLDYEQEYATGFVKPKTTSIFFDKILITDDLLDYRLTRLGYTDIPEEVRLRPHRVTQRFFHHASTYILDMDYHGEVDLDTFNDVMC